MYIIRHTTDADIPSLMEVFREAREQMRADGNMHQWPDSYPSEEQIRFDIARDVSYVMEEDGGVVATFAFIQGIEPTYDKIYEGEWVDDVLPYATIHRIAKRHTAHGVFKSCFDFCLSRCRNLRIDTHADNRIMQHVILSNGFRYCGIIHLANGAERLAYQLIQTPETQPLLYFPLGEGVEAFSTCRDGVLPYPVLQCHQVHDEQIAVIDNPLTTRDELQGIDAMVTDLPSFAIGVRTADCVPVLVYDPVHKAVAAIHAGWRGTVKHIVSKTLDVMHARYGTEPAAVVAAIGPSIGPDSFQVGDEVVEAFRAACFPMALIHTWRGERMPGSMQGGHHIDLWEANAWLLRTSGVQERNIHICGICTYEHNDRFYSARREGIRCPRIINAIKIIG